MCMPNVALTDHLLKKLYNFMLEYKFMHLNMISCISWSIITYIIVKIVGPTDCYVTSFTIYNFVISEQILICKFAVKLFL